MKRAFFLEGLDFSPKMRKIPGSGYTASMTLGRWLKVPGPYPARLAELRGEFWGASDGVECLGLGVGGGDVLESGGLVLF